MSEQSETSAPEPTGDSRVDDVVGSLDRLDDLPVGEHVAVFESAHDALRGALTDADPGDTSGPA